MRLREVPSRLHRLEQSRLFKIVASAVVVAAAVIFYVSYAVRLHDAPTGMVAVPELGPEADPVEKNLAATQAIVNDILSARTSAVSVAGTTGIVAAFALAVIWLGLGLTYLGLVVGVILALLLASLSETARRYAPVAVGVLVLTAAFVTLMQLARAVFATAVGLLALAGAAWAALQVAIVLLFIRMFEDGVVGLEYFALPVMAAFAIATTAGFWWWLVWRRDGLHQVAAIASNVLAEAVRLRLSVFFIVLLIVAMASLPGLLEPEQPLRYRVQAFLQYGTGGSFWLIAVLVVTFSVATVSFDQRDKTIWQTMTKPVAPWQYVLGKWLGVVVLAGVLQGVCGAGVFMFVEFLRQQPATGETVAYISDTSMISDDRLILDSQVLAARETRQPELIGVDPEQLELNLNASIENELNRLAGTAEADRVNRDEVAKRMRASLLTSVQQSYRSIAPSGFETYRFTKLQAARDSNRPITLRFKINAGTNAPDALYRITVRFQGGEAEVREFVPAQFQIINLLPEVISEDGAVEMQVVNGDIERRVANPETISFPPDGLEISYSAGGYRANFARVMVVLWIKLAFLAMVGVTLSTFLSFPVACLVTITVFLAAEGSRFVHASLENFWTEDREGKTMYFNTGIALIAKVISWVFMTYGDLRPTARLVEGLRMSWAAIGVGASVLALWTAVLFAAGVLALRRRELAVYSGQ